jgi:hypothetical protein
MITDISSVSRTLSLDFAGAPYLSTQSNVQTLPYSRQRPNRRYSGMATLPEAHARRSPSAYRGERELARMNVDVIVAAGKYLRYLKRRGTAAL